MPIPQPKVGEVQIAMDSVGICGSDVAYLTKGCIGDFVVRKPMILGHESSGVVSKLGEGVTHLKIGDRVAIEPGVPCRSCEFCKTGHYNLCPDVVFCATPPGDGNLARFFCTAADFCFKLPDHVSLEEGALLEPLSVGVHACKRANIGVGDYVLVCGAGPIGLMAMMAAKAMGAAGVCISDISEKRLEFAKTIGATCTVLSDTKDASALASRVEEALGCQPDATVDCCGAETAIQLGILASKPGGVLVLVGHGLHEPLVPLVTAATKEVDIKGVFRYCNDYPTSLAMVATGQVNVKSLITHRFTLEESHAAYETARIGAGIKIMISCAKK